MFNMYEGNVPPRPIQTHTHGRTIKDIKDFVASRINKPAQNISMYFNGTELKDELPAESYSFHITKIPIIFASVKA
jgi:hypothetical protein